MAHNYKIGIYAIEHKPSGRCYIGQATDIYRRWTHHRCRLRQGLHHCQHLQRLWNKYGSQQFRFVILAECKLNNLNRLEKHWAELLPVDKLVNVHPVGKCVRGWKHSAETRAKMSAAAKRVADSPEQRKIRSNRAKLQHKTGIFQYRKRKIKPRVCINCNSVFNRQRYSNGKIKQSKYCYKCRPKQLGGYYVHMSRPKQRYPGTGK